MSTIAYFKAMCCSVVFRRLSFMWLLGLFALFTPLAQAAQHLGDVLVVGVSDGDSITVLDADKKQHKIRLMGIDAPESRQDFGVRSKMALSQKVYGRRVAIHYREKDRFGRIVGKVVFAGRDINLEMVQAGFAWHYTQYAKGQFKGDAPLYEDAQRAAKADRLGLWAHPNAVAPWEFRRERRSKK